MPVSAESAGFSILMVRFILPYLLGAKKSSLYRTKSETQKDHLIVKTTERKKQCVTFKTCSRFSVVTSVAMRAFLQERSEKYFQNKLLESKRQTISLACSVLKGRAQKDVFEATMFE